MTARFIEHIDPPTPSSPSSEAIPMSQSHRAARDIETISSSATLKDPDPPTRPTKPHPRPGPVSTLPKPRHRNLKQLFVFIFIPLFLTSSLFCFIIITSTTKHTEADAAAATAHNGGDGGSFPRLKLEIRQSLISSAPRPVNLNIRMLVIAFMAILFSVLDSTLAAPTFSIGRSPPQIPLSLSDNLTSEMVVDNVSSSSSGPLQLEDVATPHDVVDTYDSRYQLVIPDLSRHDKDEAKNSYRRFGTHYGERMKVTYMD